MVMHICIYLIIMIPINMVIKYYHYMKLNRTEIFYCIT
nr:MAG TPA: hypothetical protein [Caudoviricetes sp.]DAY42239.1 MAG TPA: hypothetical protein [Caudoviricetes sp.]